MAVWSVGDVIDTRYEVAEVLGRGSMGVVYRVHHLAWGTDLAVKSPRPALVGNPAARDLFVTEAETWVSLGLHPNVCGCHYVRTLGGIPRVFAEYVPGGSLREWIADGRLYQGDPQGASARILDVAVQMAWGLDHAHSRGLVHQDVKPANVLLDAAGTAKITDFGLALARGAAATLDEDAPPGASTLVPGGGGMTPEYASPEQMAGRPLGRRTDVYSFAVSLLEMFTGAITWDTGPDAAAALAGCRTGGAAGLPAMPPGLADLLEGCLHADPGRRPGSMAEVVTALTGVYQDVVGSPYPRAAPVPAELLADEFNNRALSLLDLRRPDEAEEALRKALAADPQNVAARYNAGLARWRGGTIGDEEIVAELEALRVDAGDPWQARQLLAQVHMERGDLASARTLLEDAAREQPDEPDVTAALDTVRSGGVTDARCVGAWELDWPPYTGHESIRRGNPISGETAREAVLSIGWRTSLHDDAALALTPDGRLAVTGTWDGKVRSWDVRSGQCLRTLDGHGTSVRNIALTPDGRFALSADEEGIVCFWDLTDSRSPRKHRLAVQERAELRLARVGLSDDGLAACWASAQGFVVLDTSSGEQWRSRQGHGGGARAVLAGPQRRLLLSSGRERGGLDELAETVRVWDLETGRCRHVLTGHTSWVTAMCFTADERFAATASHDRTIRIWDLADGSCVHALRGHTADTLSLSADARFLLSGDVFDGKVRFWDVGSGRCLRTFPGHEKGVGVVVLEPGGEFALSAGQDRKVRRWRLPGGYRAGQSLSRPRTHNELSRLGDEVNALVADAEQAMADCRFPAALALLTRARATPGHEREPNVLSAWWKVSRHTVRTGLRAAWSPRVLTGHTDSVHALDMTADGRLAVSASSDGTVRTWDLGSGTCLRVMKGHEKMVESVCLSPDGRSALSGSRDGTVRLWSLDTGECRRVLGTRASLSSTPRVRFTGDGRQAVIGHPNDNVSLWDLDTGRRTRPLWRHAVKDIATADDGHLVAATVAAGDKVILHDLRRPGDERVLRGEWLRTMFAVSLSADGRLALTGESGGIRLWNTRTGQVLRTFNRADPLENYSANSVVRMSADGGFALSGGHSSSLKVWDVTTGRLLRTLDDHEPGATSLAMTPDARFVLAGSTPGPIRLWELDWDLASGEQYGE